MLVTLSDGCVPTICVDGESVPSATSRVPAGTHSCVTHDRRPQCALLESTKTRGPGASQAQSTSREEEAFLPRRCRLLGTAPCDGGTR
eukprot:scaffold2045_cov404-Prasinococcus_capsulatus_cf.AAC.75